MLIWTALGKAWMGFEHSEGLLCPPTLFQYWSTPIQLSPAPKQPSPSFLLLLSSLELPCLLGQAEVLMEPKPPHRCCLLYRCCKCAYDMFLTLSAQWLQYQSKTTFGLFSIWYLLSLLSLLWNNVIKKKHGCFSSTKKVATWPLIWYFIYQDKDLIVVWWWH